MSGINVFSRPSWLNSRLRIVIVERVSGSCIEKISGHLEWASTTTKKLGPLIEPAKSTCIQDHGCSRYIQCVSKIRGGFFCASMQGMQLLTVFSMSVYVSPVNYAFIWLIPECPGYSCLRTVFLSVHGNYNTVCKHQTIINDIQRGIVTF